MENHVQSGPTQSFYPQSGALNSQSPENRTTLARLIFKVLSVTSTSEKEKASIQRPFQDPKLEVPTIYIWPIF